MTDSETVEPWLVVRQDDNGNRYRVACYPTRAEAQQAADRLDGDGRRLYVVEPAEGGTL